MAEDRTGIDRVVPGTPENVVEFAERQVFSPATTVMPVPTSAPRRSLQRVLCDLQDSEINAGLQTFAFDTFRVWLGDELNGHKAEASFDSGDAAWADDAAIAHWLHETAIRL